VLIRGIRRPLAGTVTMDQVMIDCGPVGTAPVEVGDEVVLLGRQGDEEITADEWAGLLGTISYEVLCGIGPRVPRLIVEGTGGSSG
jgi:alanine racemase